MIENISFNVYGMTCNLCSMRIKTTLEKLEGVVKVNVNYASEKVKLEYDNAKIDLKNIKKKIELLGFSL